MFKEGNHKAWIEYYKEKIEQGDNYILGDLSVYRVEEEYHA